MVVTLNPQLEAALKEKADQQGMAPEDLVVRIIRDYFLSSPRPEPQDEWERGLLAAAREWGVSFSNSALGSEGLYE